MRRLHPRPPRPRSSSCRTTRSVDRSGTSQTGRWELARTGPATASRSHHGGVRPRLTRQTRRRARTPPGRPVLHGNSHVANAVFTGRRGCSSSRARGPSSTAPTDAHLRPRVVAGGQQGQRRAQLRTVETYQSGGAHLRRPRRRLLDAESLARDGAGGDPTGGTRTAGSSATSSASSSPARRSREHQSLYYGYVGTHGGLDGRVEFPARPHAALGGRGTSWTRSTSCARALVRAGLHRAGERGADGAARLVRVGHRRARRTAAPRCSPARSPPAASSPPGSSTSCAGTALARFGPARRRRGSRAAPARLDADPPHLGGQPLRRVCRPGRGARPARRRRRGPPAVREPRRGRRGRRVAGRG